MRIMAGCLLFLTALATPQQTSLEFRNRYGRPDMERYLVRPEINLTVEYGSDSAVCRMVLNPKPLTDKKGEGRLLSADDVTQILNEVVPPETRGADVGPAVSVGSGSNSLTGEIYENVVIMHVTHDCPSLKPKCEVNASVTFRRPACVSFTDTR
jgi:hypothetical protein